MHRDRFKIIMKDLEQLLAETKDTIKIILKEDGLKHLPADITIEEIKCELQLVHGHSMILYLKHGDGSRTNIIVPTKNTTVNDLKKSVEKQMNLQLRRRGIGKRTSWKYVWKTNWLSFDGIKLTNENMLLSELGLESHSEITLVKRLKDKIRIR